MFRDGVFSGDIPRNQVRGGSAAGVAALQPLPVAVAPWRLRTGASGPVGVVAEAVRRIKPFLPLLELVRQVDQSESSGRMSVAEAVTFCPAGSSVFAFVNSVCTSGLGGIVSPVCTPHSDQLVRRRTPDGMLEKCSRGVAEVATVADARVYLDKGPNVRRGVGCPTRSKSRRVVNCFERGHR